MLSAHCPHERLPAVCAMWLQTQAGEGRSTVTMCLKNDLTGARLRGKGERKEGEEDVLG